MLNAKEAKEKAKVNAVILEEQEIAKEIEISNQRIKELEQEIIARVELGKTNLSYTKRRHYSDLVYNNISDHFTKLGYKVILCSYVCAGGYSKLIILWDNPQ
jgi:hypothetical protein